MKSYDADADKHRHTDCLDLGTQIDTDSIDTDRHRHTDGHIDRHSHTKRHRHR